MTEDFIEMAQTVARYLLNKKARALSILDVRELTSYTDYLVVCSADSQRQVRAIAEHAMFTLKQEGFRPLGVEGMKESQWVLIDYGGVIVHIFHTPVREFYNLDGLWADAQHIEPIGGVSNG